MIRSTTLLLILALVSATAAPREIPSPAAPGAMGPALAKAPDGSVLLSWLEPAGGETWALKFSRYDPAAQRWGGARLIAQGEDWFINWADFPQLAAGPRGQLTAVWFVNNPSHAGTAHGHHGPGYRAVYSQSADGGATWSPALPVSDASVSTEFVALQPLADGRLLAAWLDGRARAAGEDRQTLHARVLGGPEVDRLVDARVCDCCQIAAVAAGPGAVLAYRGRSADEVRDMRTVRFDGERWATPEPLHADGWQIAACPVNGPRLAAHPDRLDAVWFTGAAEQPRVLAANSRVEGGFGAPVRVDLGRPEGRVDALARPDGSTCVTWIERSGQEGGAEGGVYLRRLRAGGTLDAPVLLAATSTKRAAGFPRLVGLDSSQLLLAYTVAGEPSRVTTLLIPPE